MKAIKIIFSILGVTLATISFGQLVSHHESFNETDLNLSKFIDNNTELFFYSSEYNEESGKVTHWVSHLPDRKLRDAAHKEYKPSIVSRTYFAKEMEISYESVPVIEEWMTVPFKDGFMEPDMHMESWMSTPFESVLDEKELEIESWMTAAWI